MAVNNDPIYSRRGEIANSQAGVSTAFPAAFDTANTAVDGTGTVTTIFTADATNGSYLKSIIIKQAKAVAVSTACVARFFINNGQTNATAGNNLLYKEFVLPAVTPSSTVASPDYEIPCNLPLREGMKINAVISVTQTTTGFVMYGVGGSF